MAKYDPSTEEGNCIFCEIVKGNIETVGKFWEDENHVAFLTPWASTEGFTVVATKKHLTSDCLELSEIELNGLIQASKKVSQILKKHFKDVGRVGLMMEGTGINHAHTKLFPMHNTEHMKKGIWKQYLETKDVYFEEYEGYITSQEGPKQEDEIIRKLASELREVKI
jgi:histidine triad (HIT) family protein